jgi:hypothetical protein
MEKGDARLFQQETTSDEHTAYDPRDWNIVELESHRLLHQKINELIRLTTDSTLTTSDLQQLLRSGVEHFGDLFALHLVRSLDCDDQCERQSVVWLLTLLNDKATIPALEQISRNTDLSRPIRLSASLALAGMGTTPEMQDAPRRVRFYAIN